MDLSMAALMVLLIVAGSMLALRGGDVLRAFARLLGGSFLGGAGAYVGFRLGDFFGGDWTIAYALSMGALGFVAGFLFGPKLLQLVLTLAIFVMSGGIGYFVAEELGGDGAVPFLAGAVVGLAGAWILSSIARRLLLAATIVLGSAMSGAGILVLSVGDLPLEDAAMLSFGAFIILAISGFLVHRVELSGSEGGR